MLRIRPILGVMVLLTAAVMSCSVSLTQAVRLQADVRYPRRVADYDEQRLNDIRPRLPPFTSVNYINDRSVNGEDAVLTGYLTQYSLAPAIVVIDGPPQSRVLVDGRPEVAPILDAKRRLVLEHNAGNGVRLYRVEEP